MKTPTIAMSELALEHDAIKYRRSPAMLIDLVHKYWSCREPGVGRKNLNEVVVVPIRNPKDLYHFRNNWTDISTTSRITGKVVRRQPHEDPYVALRGRGKALPTKVAKVVLYSATTLLQDDGKRSSNADWEIVAILTGPWVNEPMNPLTMARNFLRKPGGTFAPYTAHQFADAVWFWSQVIQNRS
jgi:hypothetical protein